MTVAVHMYASVCTRQLSFQVIIIKIIITIRISKYASNQARIAVPRILEDLYKYWSLVLGTI